jgi:hypothetical protein
MTTLSYRFDHTPSTNLSSIFGPQQTTGAAIILTAAMLLGPIQNENIAPPTPDRYYIRQLNGTHSQLQSLFTGEYTKQSDFNFEGSMTNFYAKLLAQQESLGAEFEKILYANLWEMYED